MPAWQRGFLIRGGRTAPGRSRLHRGSLPPPLDTRSRVAGPGERSWIACTYTSNCPDSSDAYAIHRPSGDTTPCTSEKGVDTTARGAPPAAERHQPQVLVRVGHGSRHHQIRAVGRPVAEATRSSNRASDLGRQHGAGASDHHRAAALYPGHARPVRRPGRRLVGIDRQRYAGGHQAAPIERDDVQRSEQRVEHRCGDPLPSGATVALQMSAGAPTVPSRSPARENQTSSRAAVIGSLNTSVSPAAAARSCPSGLWPTRTPSTCARPIDRPARRRASGRSGRRRWRRAAGRPPGYRSRRLRSAAFARRPSPRPIDALTRRPASARTKTTTCAPSAHECRQQMCRSLRRSRSIAVSTRRCRRGPADHDQQRRIARRRRGEDEIAARSSRRRARAARRRVASRAPSSSSRCLDARHPRRSRCAAPSARPERQRAPVGTGQRE